MTFPYLVEDGRAIRCLCKGCGATLWKRDDSGHTIYVLYGDLYLALADDAGVLSQHSTPCCPACAVDAIDGKIDLEEWWGADVFHWFIEERCIGKDPTAAYQVAWRLRDGRHAVRALRYVPHDPHDPLR